MMDAYGKLVAFLDRRGAADRLIDHPPEGQTDKVSVLRGHPVGATAKCLFLIVKLGSKDHPLLAGAEPRTAACGATLARIALAFEAGRGGFWLARWLEARG
jgi:hypothetical protein